MQTEKFREFLMREHRGVLKKRPYNKKVAGDICSRCRRIEDILGIDLDNVFRKPNARKTLPDLLQEQFLKESSRKNWNDLRHALHCYQGFYMLHGEKSARKHVKGKSQLA